MTGRKCNLSLFSWMRNNRTVLITSVAVFIISSLVFRYWDEIKAAIQVIFG